MLTVAPDPVGLSFFALFALGAFVCLSPLVLLAGTCALARAAHLKSLADLQFQADAVLAPARSSFNSIRSDAELKGDCTLLLAELDRLATHWIHFLTLDDSRLRMSKLEPAQSRAVEAERVSHQAILDAVLDWKAQKLELDRARRRIKQD
ncbi:hypothetical protein JCM10207_002821 [Rhodosporidiobolus poonsookiae]